MTSLIIVVTLVLCITGLGLVVWSLFDTRKKYYNEYMSRNRK